MLSKKLWRNDCPNSDGAKQQCLIPFFAAAHLLGDCRPESRLARSGHVGHFTQWHLSEARWPESSTSSTSADCKRHVAVASSSFARLRASRRNDAQDSSTPRCNPVFLYRHVSQGPTALRWSICSLPVEQQIVASLLRSIPLLAEGGKMPKVQRPT